MADNTFAPPRVDIAGNINNLISQYQEQQKRARAQQILEQRRSVAQQIMGGQGDPTRLLMGLAAQDPQGAAGLATLLKATQTPVQKPMTAYQEWQKTHGQAADTRAVAQEERSRAQGYLGTVTPTRREFYTTYPDQAPPEYKWAIGVLTGGGGGDTGMPPPVSQPEAPQAEPQEQPIAQPGQTAPPVSQERPQATPQRLSYEKYQRIQSGKMLSPEDAGKHVNLVIGNLDNTKNAAEALLASPALDKAFGGISNVLTRSPSPGAGAGNLLPSWMVAGTGTADAQAAVKSLKDQISLAVIANMKEASGRAGSTGLGRVMQIEYAGWQNALGSLEHAQSPEAARQSLQNIIKYIDDSKANIQGALAEDYGVSPPSGISNATKTALQPTTLLPGMQTINTPPPSAAPAAAKLVGDPRQMNDLQRRDLARQLYLNQGMNQQQIVDWFKARGVDLSIEQ